MPRYHINPTTGDVGACKAKTQCPFGDLEKDHYDSKEAAAKGFEKLKPAFQDKALAALREKFFAQPHQAWDEETNRKRTKALIAEHEALVEKIDKSLHHSIGYYSFCGYKDINKYMRQGKQDLFSPDSGEKDWDKHHARNLYLLTNAYPEAEEPRILYRYRRVPDDKTPEQFIEESFGLGDTIQDGGLVSTTEDLGLVLAQMNHQKKKRYIALAIATKKGVPLQRDEERVGSIQSFEKERLLPPGNKMKVVGRTKQRVKVDRENLSREFNGNYGGYWQPLPARDCLIVELVDEDLLASETAGDSGA